MTLPKSSDGLTILIAGDSIRMLQSLQNCLISEGYTNIYSACDQETLFQMIDNVSPSIVIIDWKLTDSNKMETFLADRYKNMEKPIQFVVFYKNWIDPGTLKKTFGTFPAEFIRIPFHDDDLLILVDAAPGYICNKEEIASSQELGGSSVVEYLKNSGRSRYLEKIYDNLKLKNKYLQNEVLFLTMKLSHLNDFMHDLKRILNNLVTDIPLEHSACREEVAEAIKLVNNYLKNGYWDEFKLRFAEVHPEFYDNLLDENPSLTETDLRLCALIKLKLSSKEIATVINHTVSSVKVARNRLRAKLKTIGPAESLTHFLVKY